MFELNDKIIQEIFEAVDIANRLKLKRKNEKIAQSEMASKFSIKPSVYTKYEKGQEIPTIEVLQQILIFLDIHMEDILQKETLLF